MISRPIDKLLRNKASIDEYMLKTTVKHPNPSTKVLFVYNLKEGLEKGPKNQKLGNT